METHKIVWNKLDYYYASYTKAAKYLNQCEDIFVQGDCVRIDFVGRRNITARIKQFYRWNWK